MTQQVSNTGNVTITDVRSPCSSLGRLLRYRAIVPKVAPGERLPVLYLLHGANSGAVDVQQHGDIVKLAASERLIVVTPDADYSYYTNAKHRRHARWEDAIALDLPQDVESRFPALADREHRGVAGVSMGGYGAIKLALKHPELYGFAGTMSGPLDITRRPASLVRFGQTWRIWTIFGLRRSERRNEDVFNLLDHSPGVKNVKWFASCGAKDPLFRSTPDSCVKCTPAEFGSTASPLPATTIGKPGTQRCRCSSRPREKPCTDGLCFSNMADPLHRQKPIKAFHAVTKSPILAPLAH